MKTRTLRTSPRLTALAAAALLAVCSGAQATAVGIRVLAQEWSPAKPSEQSTRRLVDDPNAVSQVLQLAWNEARPLVCKTLSNRMGLGRAAGGYTLRDIDCVLDATPAFSVAPNGQNGLTAHLSFGGYLAATSTTPDHFDKALDPRFSINVKMNIALRISVQPNPAQTLRVDAAGFTLSDTKLDSHGLTGDILKFVVSDLAAFFTGTDYKKLAEGAVNGVAMDIAKPFNTALGPINDKLRPPSGMVRTNVWARPELIAIAFGPQAMVPPSNGSLSGVFRWGGQTPGRCDGLALAASVQTGPAPLTGVDGRFDVAYAPRKPVGDFRLEGIGAAGECRYRITGLAAGWQNDLAPKGRTEVAEVTAVRGGPKRYRVTLQGEGWDGTHVTPQPAAQGNYLIVSAPSSSPVIDPEIAANQRAPQVVGRPAPGDRFNRDSAASMTTLPPVIGRPAAPTAPVTTLGARGRSWTVPAAAAPRPGAIRVQQGAATHLNPQPLPPEPPPEKAGTSFRR